MAYKFLGVVAVLATLQVSTVLACDGYELIISEITQCAGVKDSLVNFKDFNVTISDDCKVTPEGTVTYGSITGAKLDIDVLYKGRKEMKFRRTVDFCERLANAPKLITDVLKKKNLATSCPITGRSVVADDFIVDITEYKAFLGFGVGSISGKVSTNYQTSAGTGNSCYTFKSTLKLKDGVAKKKVNRLEVLKSMQSLRALIGKTGGSGGGGSGGSGSGSTEKTGGGGFGGFGKKWAFG